MKIRKGDKVQVVKGKDRGKQGEVLAIFPEENKALVRGVNIVKRHIKAKREGKAGERIEKEAPLPLSNVMLLCPHTNMPTRVSFRTEGGEKVRYSVRAQKTI
jgi:large subunit ribosomal protein L24